MKEKIGILNSNKIYKLYMIHYSIRYKLRTKPENQIRHFYLDY